MKKTDYDIVIVGSGIAGLSTLLYLTEAALYQKEQISVCLIAKDKLDITNTDWAQGGIAAVQSVGDNFDKHVEDTMIAGAFVNNKHIVNKVVAAAPEIVNDLMRWGMLFDKNAAGELDLAKEGGHSAARILHFKDQTGHAIQSSLISRVSSLGNIEIKESCSLVQVVKNRKADFSLQLFSPKTESFETINCAKLVLATGGVGMLYEKTTNQHVASGEGICIAKSLGANIENLSFIQFHPTGLFQGGNTAFLITEALRGAGAILRNQMGEAFMHKYDSRLELAPRDIVSRSIMTEIQHQTIDHVYLDATKIDAKILEQHFPAIQLTCQKILGIDINRQLIPVCPVQHYSCGGIQVDEFGETTVPGLFAIGEVASTGLHGANRLASNSLLEAVAFAKFATGKLILRSAASGAEIIQFENPVCLAVDKLAIQAIMSEYAGIVKTNKGLSTALSKLEMLQSNSAILNQFSYAQFEVTSLLELAILLIKDAQSQQRNAGVFYNSDLSN